MSPSHEISRPEGDVNLAKQSEILLADIEHAGLWIETVWLIFDRQLPYEAFVAAYMEALGAWERGRKLAQHRLHWRYGPSRRDTRRIERDARKQVALMYAKLERRLAKTLETHPEMAKQRPELAAIYASVQRLAADGARDFSSGQDPAPSPAIAKRARVLRDMSKVPPAIAAMIQTDLGIDVATTNDKEIFDAYKKRAGEEAALTMIRALTRPGGEQ